MGQYGRRGKQEDKSSLEDGLTACVDMGRDGFCVGPGGKLCAVGTGTGYNIE